MRLVDDEQRRRRATASSSSTSALASCSGARNRNSSASSASSASASSRSRSRRSSSSAARRRRRALAQRRRPGRAAARSAARRRPSRPASAARRSGRSPTCPSRSTSPRACRARRGRLDRLALAGAQRLEAEDLAGRAFDAGAARRQGPTPYPARAAAVRAQNVNSCAAIVARPGSAAIRFRGVRPGGRREPCAAVHRCEHACSRLPSCCRCTIAAPGAARAAAPTGTAADGPGALSHFDLARKDCVGTARNRRSKVWFTVADGVLSDVYYPTNDNTNDETLQYVVTDGATFTDLQTRDMTYTVARARRPRADVPRHRDGQERPLPDRHRLPDRPRPPDGASCARASRRCAARPRDYQLYVRFDPTLNGNGGGGARQRRRRQRRRRDRRRPHAARRLGPGHGDQRRQPRLRAAGLQRARRLRGRSSRSPTASPAQPSDGLTQLDAAPRAHRRRSRDGRPRQPRPDRARSTSAATARSRSRSASARRRPRAVARRARHAARADSGALDAATTRRGWHRYDAGLVAPAAPARRLARRLGRSLLDEYYLQRELRQGGRGQDVPRRRRGRARLAVGPGDLRRRPGQHLLRLLPRGVRARPLRGVDRRCSWPATARTARDMTALPVRAPAAARRLDAAQQPHQRQARAGHVQHPARRVRLPARHGARRRPHRPRRSTRTTSSRRRTSSPATGRRSARSAGRSRAASRRRRSRPRSPA